MKKWMLTLLVASTSLSVGANANAYGSTTITSMLCDLGGGTFEVFGYALWLKPSSCAQKFVIPDDTYGERFKKFSPAELKGITANDSDGVLSPRVKGTALGDCNNYDWGFRIGLGYVTCDGCRDFRVSYSRLHATDHEAIKIQDGCDGGALWPTLLPSQTMCWDDPTANPPVKLASGASKVLVNPKTANAPEDFGTRAKASMRSRFKWDAVQAEFASRMSKGCKYFVRGHIGLEWTELRAEHRFDYQGTILIDPSPEFEQGVSAFMKGKIAPHTWGIGPRVGVDARYDIFCGFGITARLGAAILAGETRSREFVVTKTVNKYKAILPPTSVAKAAGVSGESGAEGAATASPSLTQTANCTEKKTKFDVVYPDACVVFPEIEAALGVSYENNWGTSCCFIAEIGYEFRSYINALSGASFSDEKSAVTAANCDSFNLQGLYFGVMVRI